MSTATGLYVRCHSGVVCERGRYDNTADIDIYTKGLSAFVNDLIKTKATMLKDALEIVSNYRQQFSPQDLADAQTKWSRNVTGTATEWGNYVTKALDPLLAVVGQPVLTFDHSEDAPNGTEWSQPSTIRMSDNQGNDDPEQVSQLTEAREFACTFLRDDDAGQSLQDSFLAMTRAIRAGQGPSKDDLHSVLAMVIAARVIKEGQEEQEV
jgi:hypothetical protein